MTVRLTFRRLLSILLLLYISVTLFEWFIIKWIAFNPTLVVYFRLALDVFPTILFVLSLILQQVKIVRLSLYLLSFYLISLALFIVSILVQGASMSSIPGHFGVIFRFAPLSIIISSLHYYHWNFDRLRIWAVRFLYIFLALGVLEVILQNNLRKVLLPSSELFENIFDRLPVALQPSDDYQISTTFVNPIEYCFLIIGLYIIFLSIDTSFRKKLLISFLCLLVTFNSGSIAGFLFLLILIYVVLIKKPFFKYLIYLSGIVAASVIIYRNWETISWYFEISYQYNRLGIILNTLPEFLSSGLINVLFGIGSDENHAYELITSYKTVPLMIYYDKNLAGLDDVYWIALLIYHGLIFIILLGYFFVLIINASNQMNRADSLIIKRLLLLMFCLGFINQIMEVKPFSLLFWTTIGILVNTVLNHKRWLNHNEGISETI